MSTALLEMHTGLQEMPTAKWMQANDRNSFIAAKFCSLQNEFIKVNIVRANFTIQANCPIQNYFSCQLTSKAKKEI